jgi:hypothetical protein
VLRHFIITRNISPNDYAAADASTTSYYPPLAAQTIILVIILLLLILILILIIVQQSINSSGRFCSLLHTEQFNRCRNYKLQTHTALPIIIIIIKNYQESISQ